MSRKNFLSTDFFVTASEAEAKQALCSIPLHLSHITLLKENLLLQSMRFLYENRDKTIKIYVDVSILPLNDQCVRFRLHTSYTNGHSFHSDPDMSYALHHFEQAVNASLQNDFSSLLSTQSIKPAAKKSSYITNFFLSMVLSKYHY